MGHEHEEPKRLSAARAERLLRDLRDKPFVALVFSDGELKCYSKGMNDESMKLVEDLMDEITEHNT